MNPKGDYLAAVSFCLGIIATATIARITVSTDILRR